MDKTIKDKLSYIDKFIDNTISINGVAEIGKYLTNARKDFSDIKQHIEELSISNKYFVSVFVDNSCFMSKIVTIDNGTFKHQSDLDDLIRLFRVEFKTENIEIVSITKL